MINIKNLSKMYSKDIVALKNINAVIKDSEFVFIIGASGSGKSTLLKIILKEEEITSGDVVVHGKSLNKMKRNSVPFYRRKLGIIFQDFRLIETMNIYENIAFALRIIGASSIFIKNRVLSVLKLVSLEDKANRFPRELSGGEKQRAGIARALVNNPSIIIADEPTGNIDPKMSFEIVKLLIDINKKGTTVIMVTHDMSIVSNFNFRVIELESGEIKNDSNKFFIRS